MQDLLIIRGGGIGDSVALLPVIHALHRDRPDVRVTFLLSPVGASLLRPVLGQRHIVSVARSVVSGPLSLRYLPALVSRLTLFSFRKYDTALIAFDETTVSHIAAACVAHRRIGFAAGINRGEFFLTEKLAFSPKRSVYDLLYDLARSIEGVAPDMPQPVLPGRYRASAKYGEIHAHASTSLQMWTGVMSLVPALERVSGFPWIVRYGPNDGRDLATFIKSLAGAQIALTMHSGPLHVAAALGVPVVGLAGPTAFEWDPPGAVVLRQGLACQPCGRIGRPARTCWRNDQTCLSHFSVTNILETVRSVLRKSR